MRTAAAAGLVGLALALAGCSGDGSESTTAETTGGDDFALAPTRACLVDAGADVGAGALGDVRLQALRDLAQQTSFVVVRGGETAGLAFAKSEADAKTLLDLLTVPDEDEHHALTRSGNVVVLLAGPGEEEFVSVVLGCLRG